ncbi:MAG: hypothetical protein Kow0079_09550 [Vicingaceae bacterium]
MNSLPYIVEDVFKNVKKYASKDISKTGFEQIFNLFNSRISEISSLHKPELFFVADLQNNGETVFMRNVSFDIGTDIHSVIDIMKAIVPPFLEYHAIIDKVLIDFWIEHKLQPYDMFFKVVFPVNTAFGEKFYSRTLTVIANDNNNIPHFGFGFVKEEKPIENLSPENVDFQFSKEKKHLKNVLSEKLENCFK